MNLELLKECKILNYNYGFLGESYVHIDELISCDSMIIGKYFSLKSPYYCNRNLHYYSTNLDELFSYFKTYENDVKIIINTNTSEKIKRYLLFSVVGHLINDTTKLIGLVYAYKMLRDSYLDDLKCILQKYTDNYTDLMFNECINFIEPLKQSTLNSLIDLTSEHGITSIREYSEMDHPVILLKSFFVYEEYFRNKDIYVAPLQGSSMIPAIYISLSKKVFAYNNEKYPREFSYLRTSNYDNTHHIDLSVHEQVSLFCHRYDQSNRIVLIDDNVGTGKTIRSLKQELAMSFEDILTCVVECRWETKILSEEYPAFNLNEIDIITPLEYRYYKRFDEEIDHLKNNNLLNDKYYKNQFYSLDFVYNNHDFDEFISKSEISDKNLIRLNNTVSKYKKITSIYNA